VAARKSTLKTIAGFLHLWLGMTCGLVVFFSFLGASVYVWEIELRQWYYHDEVYVENTGRPALPLSVIFEKANAAASGKVVNYVYVHNDAEKAFVFSTYKEAASPGFFCWQEMEYWDDVYVDPYTGQTNVVDMRYDWINLLMRLHIQLLLRYEIGHWIVGFSSLFVLIMIISGLVLWFPKNKAAWKQRFTIKWNAKWRRVNYDLHNVGGFYVWIGIAILSTTGLVWTFDWWEKGLYEVYGGDASKYSHTVNLPSVKPHFTTATIDKVFNDAVLKQSTWKSIYVSLPEKLNEENNEPAYFGVYIAYNTHTPFAENDVYHYHPQTGEVAHADGMNGKTFAEKMMMSNYDIHVGSLYGLPSKILACFAALFCALLPVSGFMIWFGRRFKKEKKVIKKQFDQQDKVLNTGADLNSPSILQRTMINE
jgi:uncharacterized iron-regulated membrane protein